MSTRRISDDALALMVVLAIRDGLHVTRSLTVARPLQDAEVVGCDGQTVTLDGRKAELWRLHNEARAEHSIGKLCVQQNLMTAAQAHAEDMNQRDFYAPETRRA